MNQRPNFTGQIIISTYDASLGLMRGRNEYKIIFYSFKIENLNTLLLKQKYTYFKNKVIIHHSVL